MSILQHERLIANPDPSHPCPGWCQVPDRHLREEAPLHLGAPDFFLTADGEWSVTARLSRLDTAAGAGVTGVQVDITSRSSDTVAGRPVQVDPFLSVDDAAQLLDLVTRFRARAEVA